MAVDYIPTIQSPLGGNNLSSILSALRGPKSPPSMPQITGGASNSMYNAGASLGDNLTATPSRNLFGGINYNPIASGTGISGNDMADAARAGVQSGLSFDPFTGTIS